MFGFRGNVMAGLDPAIPPAEAQRCHIIGIAGSSRAMTAGMLPPEFELVQAWGRARGLASGNCCTTRELGDDMYEFERKALITR
jgi:hypothetical protein